MGSGGQSRVLAFDHAGRNCGIVCFLYQTRYWYENRYPCLLDPRGFRSRITYVGFVAWQSHHLVAVAEGGGGCDLDGYVTLCSTCHGHHTGALRKRLNGTIVQTSFMQPVRYGSEIRPGVRLVSRGL